MSRPIHINELPPEILLEIIVVVLDSPIFHTTHRIGTFYDYMRNGEPDMVFDESVRVEESCENLRRVSKLWGNLVASFIGRFVVLWDNSNVAVPQNCKHVLFWGSDASTLVHTAALRQERGEPLHVQILHIEGCDSDLPQHLSDVSASFPYLQLLYFHPGSVPEESIFAFDLISSNLPFLRTFILEAKVSSSSPPLIFPSLEVLSLILSSWGGWNLSRWSLPSLRSLRIRQGRYVTLDLSYISHILTHVEHLHAALSPKLLLTMDACPVLKEIVVEDDLIFHVANIPDDHPLRLVIYDTWRLSYIDFGDAYALHTRGIRVQLARISFRTPLSPENQEASNYLDFRQAMKVRLSPGGGIYDKDGLSLDFQAPADVSCLSNLSSSGLLTATTAASDNISN